MIDEEHIYAQMVLHRCNKEWEKILSLEASLDWDAISSYSWVTKWADECFMAHYYLEDWEGCEKILERFQRGMVDEHILSNTDFLSLHWRTDKKWVATTDPSREPQEDEVVVIYGDYPLFYENLVHHNPIRRHYRFFPSLFSFSSVEYNACWEPIDRIFIISLKEREDRYWETLRELGRMRAPFHRIEKFEACTFSGFTDTNANGWVGCALSHLSVLKRAQEQGYKHILVLEDDFCFTSEIESHQAAMKEFWDGENAWATRYWVCLVSYSRYGTCEPIDDDSLRESSGYLKESLGIPEGTSSGYLKESLGIPEGTSSGYLKESLGIPEGTSSERILEKNPGKMAIPHLTCTTASGYLVSSQGMPSVISVMETGFEKLKATGDGRYAVDVYWTHLQTPEHPERFVVFQKKWGYQRPGYSNITGEVSFHMD